MPCLLVSGVCNITINLCSCCPWSTCVIGVINSSIGECSCTNSCEEHYVCFSVWIKCDGNVFISLSNVVIVKIWKNRGNGTPGICWSVEHCIAQISGIWERWTSTPNDMDIVTGINCCSVSNNCSWFICTIFSCVTWWDTWLVCFVNTNCLG